MVLASTTMYPAIAPNLRCVGLLVQRDLGHVSEARAEFERVAAHGFSDLPPNVARLWSIAFLAEACVLLNDAVRASTLYEL